MIHEERERNVSLLLLLLLLDRKNTIR